MENRTCFECKKPIAAEEKRVGVRVNGAFFDFHRSCVRQILQASIAETIHREEHIERLAAEQNRLADKLGYAAAEREAIAGELPIDTVCVRCNRELGFHSTDTDSCPDGSGVFCLVAYPAFQDRKVGG